METTTKTVSSASNTDAVPVSQVSEMPGNDDTVAESAQGNSTGIKTMPVHR